MALGMDLSTTNHHATTISAAIMKDVFLRYVTPHNIEREFKKIGITPLWILSHTNPS
jgi:hypothetical protein